MISVGVDVSKGKGKLTLNDDFNTFEVWEGEMVPIYPGDMVQFESQDGQEVGLNVLTIPNVCKGQNAWLGDNHIFNDHSQEIKFRNVSEKEPVYKSIDSIQPTGETITR